MLRTWRLGRAADNDYVVNHAAVSAHHAEITELHDGHYLLRDLGSRNGTYVGIDDERVIEAVLIGDETLRFSRTHAIPFALLRQHLESPGSRMNPGTQVSVSREIIRIGRDADNDIRLPLLTVSRHHAQIRRDKDGRIELEDLGSKLGTVVNGRLIRGETAPIDIDDHIEIGGHRVSFFFRHQAAPEGRFAVERHGYTLQARGLSYRTRGRNARMLIEDLSLVVRPGEMVALMGPSGSGKSTLMNLLIGELTPTTGDIYYDGADLRRTESSILPYIAHVPQEDVLNPHLTVRETLRAHAHLKLPADVSTDEIDAKIDEVCRNMGLLDAERGIDLRDRLIGSVERRGLSGGQKKRVSLAMELLSDPKILFLDEPTSGLSSSDTRSVIETLRQIATEKSFAVVVTIHQPSLQIFRQFDLALFLKAGRLVYYGTAYPDAPAHFCSSDQPGDSGPDEIMETLDREETTQLALRYARSALPDRFLRKRWVEPSTTRSDRSAQRPVRPTRLWTQLRVLCSRDCRAKSRERLFLGVLAAQPILIGLLIGQLFPYPDGPIEPATVAFLAALVSFWFGLNLANRELVAERVRMRRERRGGLSPMAYLGGKVVVLSTLVVLQISGLLALLAIQVHTLSWPIAHVVAIGWVTAVTGIAVGLAISAYATSEVSAVAFVPLVLIPMILLGGHLRPYEPGLSDAPMARLAAAFSPLRWSYEAFTASCLRPGAGFFGSPGWTGPTLILGFITACALVVSWTGVNRR